MAFWSNFGRWAAGKGSAAAGRYGSLGPVGKSTLIGAATGGMTGAFGLNPMNTLPFAGDVDAGGFFGGALAGAGAGALYGRFGAGKKLFGRATAGLEEGLRTRGQMGSLIGKEWAGVANKAHGALLKTNKYGDQIMAGMAAGSAGLIGGTVLSTNSPY